jgi:hypothetical protein
MLFIISSSTLAKKKIPFMPSFVNRHATYPLTPHPLFPTKKTFGPKSNMIWFGLERYGLFFCNTMAN